MKKFIANAWLCLAAAATIVATSCALLSCSNDEEVIAQKTSSLSQPNQAPDIFLSTMTTMVEEKGEVDLSFSETDEIASTQALPTNSNLKLAGNAISTKLYVGFPELTQAKIERVQRVSTLNDIQRLVKETNAMISLSPDEFTDTSIELSNEKALEIVTPLIKESKQYLYGKGFTEQEIQYLIAEVGSDESVLVPFVLYIAEQEEHENRLCEDLGIKLDPVTGLETIGGQPLDPKFDWRKATSCALEAFGISSITDMLSGRIKKMTKKALMSLCKAIAKEVAGPIAAILIVADFAWCMQN